MPPLLRAAHFEPTVAVTAVTTLLAVGLGLRGRAGWVAAAVLCGQLAVGWHNDWVDAARDRAAGRDDKPVARGQVHATTLRALTPIALVAALALSAPLGAAAVAWHGAGLAGGLAHNALLKGTAWSVAPWMASFGALPAFAWAAAGSAAPWWAWTAGALLGGGAHFINALPDLEADARTGVRGLPHRLGPTGSVIAGGTLMGAGAVTIAAGGPASGGASGADAAVAAAVTLCLATIGATMLAAVAGRRRLAFRLTMLAAAVLVVTLVAAGAVAP